MNKKLKLDKQTIRSLAVKSKVKTGYYSVPCGTHGCTFGNTCGCTADNCTGPQTPNCPM